VRDVAKEMVLGHHDHEKSKLIYTVMSWKYDKLITRQGSNKG
jgi:hypothetical protein